MKTHILTFLLLALAAITFVIGFSVDDELKQCCDIVAFSFPTIAAVVEIVLAERSTKALLNELSKRPVWHDLTQEEFDWLKAEGKLNENDIYATYEERSM